MADEDKGATPEQAPPNVVTDNSGQVPVQPVGTSDPTLTDNTNPKVPFDGSDPRNIPPHDSNEQLHIAADKRADADAAGLSTAADKRRRAVEAAYDNNQDVRDVLGSDETGSASDGDEGRRQDAARGARTQPPQGRSSKPPTVKG